MIIGVPKEIKNHEYRVAVSPAMVQAFIERGHQVLIETGAGKWVGYSDEIFTEAGAKIVATPEEVYEAEMIIKVKEPQECEFPLLKERQVLFSFLHLAPDPVQTRHLVEKKIIAIAYETVTDTKGHLPLLLPMSEIAGRTAIQVGAVSLQINQGGRGLLLGGVPGVTPARVVVIGGGTVGTEAARMAMGLGARVTVVDNNLARLRELDLLFGPTLHTLYSTTHSLEKLVRDADLLIGSVLIPGKLAPKLITRQMIKEMEPGSVFVDVAIDQGGCAETSHPTTHDDPTFVVDEVVHYCVTNIPGACARTATQALTNATMRYALRMADQGYQKVMQDDPGFRDGLNVYMGYITNEAVAQDLGYEYVPPEKLF